MVADTLEVLAYPDPTLRQVCEDCIVAGTDVNRRIARRLGLSVEQAVCDGARARAGSALMVVSGRASSLHAMWKVGQNVYLWV